MAQLRRKSDLPSPFFRAGESIPSSGIYRVYHSQHRVSHDVLLLHGDPFPRCSECGQDVHFELIRAMEKIADDPNFQIRLFEIPHPERERRKAKTAVQQNPNPDGSSS